MTLKHQVGQPRHVYLAPAVGRAMQILDLLADNGGTPVSLTDLARAIDAAKSSTSNICAVLEDAGMITRTQHGYSLGRHTAELGGAWLSQFDQIAEFYRACHHSPVLRTELVQMAVLHGTDILYLARHDGRSPLRLSAGANVGDHYPASVTALGNALLSTLSPLQVDALYRDTALPQFTARSTQTLEQLHAKLALARERGYALDEGEVFPNVAGIAMPVPPRASGDNVFAVNVSRIVPLDPPAIDHDTLVRLREALKELVDSLTNPMTPRVENRVSWD